MGQPGGGVTLTEARGSLSRTVGQPGPMSQKDILIPTGFYNQKGDVDKCNFRGGVR